MIQSFLQESVTLTNLQTSREQFNKNVFKVLTCTHFSYFYPVAHVINVIHLSLVLKFYKFVDTLYRISPPEKTHLPLQMIEDRVSLSCTLAAHLTNL